MNPVGWPTRPSLLTNPALRNLVKTLTYFPMATLLEVEEQALLLPEDQRARLAAHLLDSLPAVLHEEDAGVAEALRRDAELEADPSSGMTLEAFKAAFGR